ncbi:MAG: BLUF domain-containing protein [Flavitalea sp.]
MDFILYLSTAKALFTDEALQKLLELSRANNQQQDISGMLLYHDGAFLQVLEGEKANIETLYRKLEKDTRHYEVLQIMAGQSEHRYFPEWSMGFRKLSANEWNTIPGLVPLNQKALTFQDSPGVNKDMLTFIRSFCRVNFQ